MKKMILSLATMFAVVTIAIGQNVGIGTNTPVALLHVNNGNVLFSGPNMLGNTVLPPVKGKGIRTFWYPEKAAFRTGGVYNATISGFPDADTSNFHNWDKDSIGAFSFAAGFNTKAKGSYSFAAGVRSFAIGDATATFGIGNNAKGDFSFVAGSSNKADGNASLAFGNGCVASGNYSAATGNFTTSSGVASTSMGGSTVASGNYSTASGVNSTASGDRSVSMGDNTAASGSTATSMGEHTVASGDYSTAVGSYTVAGGDYSTAIGKTAKATGYASFAFGNNTIASGSNSTAMGVNANTGNHTNSFCIAGALNDVAATNTNDNQMMMRFNNYTFWVSTSNYAYLIPASNGWAYTSDKYKKDRFLELNGESVLKKISTIPFYSWNFKASDTKQYRHYGIMAQDFYSAFGKDEYGNIGNDSTVSPLDLLGVAYSAIKALEKRTETLQAQNNNMAEQIIAFKIMKGEMEKLQEAVEAIRIKIKN